MFHPKISHELELRRLAQYLKETQVHGLVIDQNSNIMKFNSYPDAEFEGMYGHENPDDLACAKISNAFIIMFYD